MCRRALVADFARGRITVLRRAVTTYAAGMGLTGRRLEDFVLAVNEITTNAVLHGGGRGRLRLWARDGRLWCEVTDEGPGLPPGWMGSARTPSRYDPGGRGLWLTRMLCDHVTIVSTPGGTSVTFSAGTR
ncbi:ATP-binding protein [Nonomuraea muscovyensis]|uniref:Anti-sigma regulatory factor (Ser/Thr protein kinase) n=1 Tax=Nonomuraea muscovyensis TaxID=1124761 RepID=A0A7X0BZP1_9ACTN|nr:ATP-binding protein [Nonomuraea muscovyensis]MBB6343934.1 anti-sigma regulatory factor (Ser/Thr protein kinase) [Nonomuraea muscovyensis]